MSSLNLAARAGRCGANNRKKGFFGPRLVAAVALDVGAAAAEDIRTDDRAVPDLTTPRP
jgi:hypothetical protein